MSLAKISPAEALCALSVIMVLLSYVGTYVCRYNCAAPLLDMHLIREIFTGYDIHTYHSNSLIEAYPGLTPMVSKTVAVVVEGDHWTPSTIAPRG